MLTSRKTINVNRLQQETRYLKITIFVKENATDLHTMLLLRLLSHF